MVRHRIHMTFALGRFNEGVQWVRELNDACRAAGCVEGKLWAAGFGKFNECVMERDYPNQTAMEHDFERFHSTAAIMAIFRRGNEVGAAQDWPWDELLVEAPTLA